MAAAAACQPMHKPSAARFLRQKNAVDNGRHLRLIAAYNALLFVYIMTHESQAAIEY